jgi:hypothetical protein
MDEPSDAADSRLSAAAHAGQAWDAGELAQPVSCPISRLIGK